MVPPFVTQWQHEKCYWHRLCRKGTVFLYGSPLGFPSEAAAIADYHRSHGYR